MGNIIYNLVNSIFTNAITIIFLSATVAYAILKIFENKNLYDFINENLDEINRDNRNSRLYLQIRDRYKNYIKDVSYGDINITSFTEEIFADFTYKRSFILDKIKGIKNASSICILLGVLGTFVGLSMMLLSVDTKDLINSLPQTISSMQTAFTTSIFGIVFSMVIGLCIRLKDCENTLIQLMLKVENLLTAEITHSKSQIMDLKIEDVKNTIKQISKSIESIEKFDKISKDLNDFNEEFISGIEALKDLLHGSENSIKTFDQSIRKLDKQINIMNIKFNRLFDKYDGLDEINKEILLDIKESTKNIYNSTESQSKIKDYIKNISAGYAVYERSAQDLLNKLIYHEENISSNQINLSENKVELDNSIKNLSTIVSTSSKDIQEKIDSVFEYIDIYKEALNIVSEESSPDDFDNNSIYRNEEIYEIEKETELQEPSQIYAIVKNVSEDELND